MSTFIQASLASQPNATIVELRTQLVEAQERMLHYAIDAWRLDCIPFRDVLDVGCGLGGGAIFWAQNLGSKVTAITIAPSHVKLVQRFAMQAGVESLVEAVLSDASAVPGVAMLRCGRGNRQFEFFSTRALVSPAREGFETRRSRLYL